MHEQIEFFAIPNPCKNRCESDKNGYCLQCYRSRVERFQWHYLSESEKRDVVRLCRLRRRRKHALSLKQSGIDEKESPDQDKQLDLF